MQTFSNFWRITNLTLPTFCSTPGEITLKQGERNYLNRLCWERHWNNMCSEILWNPRRAKKRRPFNYSNLFLCHFSNLTMMTIREAPTILLSTTTMFFDYYHLKNTKYDNRLSKITHIFSSWLLVAILELRDRSIEVDLLLSIIF